MVALSSGLLLLRVRLTRASDGAGGCELEAAPLPPAASSLPPCEPKCLAFSPDGTRLAVGCEDGRLRLHAWPSLALLCDRPAAHGDAVSDADFSDDGLQLLTTGNEAAGSGGGAAVWAVARDGGALTRLLWLPPPPARSRARGGRAVFRGARFGRGAALGCAFTGLNVGGAGRVVAWRSATWAQLSDSAALDTPLTALTASPTGGLVAVGGCEGAVALLGGSAPRWALRPRLAHTQAHMVFVTALSFAPSGALLASVSGAGSCRVTAAPGRRSAAAAALRHALLFLAQLLLAALLLRIVKVLFLDA